MLVTVALTAALVLVLLAASVRGARRVEAAAKLLASSGFVALALQQGALQSRFGVAVLVALGLCWLGDAFLLSRGSRWFLAGLGAFLGGHLAFAIAFGAAGLEVTVAALAATVLLVPAAVVLRWLGPHVPPPMRVPVSLYVVVLTATLACAMGASAAGGPARLAIGAAAFYLSDLAVARERFVAPGLANRLWGLPLYYAAQLTLASTV